MEDFFFRKGLNTHLVRTLFLFFLVFLVPRSTRNFFFFLPRCQNAVRVRGGMSLRNGMWHDLWNGIIILAEWHNYAECNFLKINYTKKARQFFKRSRIVSETNSTGATQRF